MTRAERRIAWHIRNLGSDDMKVACRAEGYLLRHYTERASEALVEASADPHPERRWRAAWVLAACRRPEALPALTRLLDDPVDFVRYEATVALGLLEDAGMVPALMDMLRPGRLWQEDGTPVYLGLSRLGETAAAAVLAYESDPDKQVRGMVAHFALNECKASWAAPYRAAFEGVCRRLADDPSADVRSNAQDALDEMGCSGG